jgi:hypothetical protein
MSFQRIHKSSSQSPQTSSNTSLFGPPPVPMPETKRPPTQAQQDNQAHQQHQFEVTGLQLKAEYGTITPVEQEKLGLLQAKMDAYIVQQMKLARAQPNILEILVRNAQSKQATESAAAVQPKLTIGQQDGSEIQRMMGDGAEEKTVVKSSEELRKIVSNIKSGKEWTGNNYSSAWECNTISTEVCKVVADCTLKTTQEHVLVVGGSIPGGTREGNTGGINYWYFSYHTYVVWDGLLYDPTFEREIQEGDIRSAGTQKDAKVDGLEDEIEYFDWGSVVGSKGNDDLCYVYASLDALVNAVQDPETAVAKFWNPASSDEES